MHVTSPLVHTYVCVYAAGELLRESRKFLQENMHPRVIVRAYIKALDVIVGAMERCSRRIDVNDEAALLAIAATSVGK